MAWKQEDIREALTFLALYSGNAGLAVVALKEEKGKTFQPNTLRKWRAGEYAELYDELREAVPDMTEGIIRDALETAKMAAMTERLAIERTHADLASGNCKDPARAARDLSHIKATNVEKFLTLTGRPTEIVRHESPLDLMQGLVNDGVFRAVDPAAAASDDDLIVIDLPDTAAIEIFPELGPGLTPEGAGSS